MGSFVLQTFPFVHPSIAGIALATGLIPILVHLINRRRYVRVPWAAMSFLLAANRRSARRVRLEQWLLLAVRIGAIVLMGLAIARPYLPASAMGPLRSSRVHRIIVLDNSLSMKAHSSEGVRRFDLAKAYARRLLDSFPSMDAISMITMSEPAEAIIAQAAYDRRFVRERLATIVQSERGTDTAGALIAAIEILKTSQMPAGNRAVYVISDFPRRVWQSETPDQPSAAAAGGRRLADGLADSATDLVFVRIASDVDPGRPELSSSVSGIENLAVTRLTTESPLIGVNVPVRIVAEVTNYGSSSADRVVLQIRRGREIIRREPLPRLTPGASHVAVISTEFSNPGTHLIEARLIEPFQDALADDDARYLSVEVRRASLVLLVDGRPGATRLAGHAGFLATALAPKVAAGESSFWEPKTITEPELAGEVLLDYDVVVLCNVQRLASDSWRRLEGFVAAGGGLMIFLGDLVSTDNYNRHGYREGEGLLPGKLQHPVGGGPNPAPTATSQAPGHYGLKLDRLVHPVVAEFGTLADSGLFSARVERYLPIELDPDRADVLLRYTSNDPALIASAFENGRTLLWTTTANMDWTNLPAKGDYVSLTLSSMAFLSPRHGDHRNVIVGKMLHERLTPVQSSWPLHVLSGEAGTSEPALVPDGDTLALEYGPIEHAGPVTISIGPETRLFTANVDTMESDLIPIDDAELLGALDRPVRLVTDATAITQESSAARSTEFASLALYAVVCLLLLEIWLAMLFGSRRASDLR